MDRRRLSILPGDSDTPEVGGGEPFESYVRRDGRRLVGLAYTLCGSRVGAEDLVQDALLAAFQNWEVIRQPREDEGFMVSFQDSEQWEGGYPVCWAVYQSDVTGCEFFALHMDGDYSEAIWEESGTEGSPCEINLTSDPQSYRDYPKP